MQLEVPLQLRSSGAAPQLGQPHDGKRLVETSGGIPGALTLTMALRPFSWEDPRASGSGRGSDPWSLGMPGSGLGRMGDSLHGQHLASPPACETSQEVWDQLCPQERPMIREFSPLGVEAAGSLSTGNAA